MIVLFGIAGSGKGTQAEIIAQRLDCPIVTTGDILRKNADMPEIKAATEAGVLVDDDITLSLLDKEFEHIEAERKEFILDGSPRSLRQAEWLDQKIKEGRVELTAIIHLNLSKEAALKRLKLRARDDDTEASINKRFEFYGKSVLPALNYLAQQGYKTIEIDGDQPVGVIADQIKQKLGK